MEIYPNPISYRAGRNRMRWLGLLTKNVSNHWTTSLVSELCLTSGTGAPLFRFTPGMNCSLRRPDSGPSRCGDALRRAGAPNSRRDTCTMGQKRCLLRISSNRTGHQGCLIVSFTIKNSTFRGSDFRGGNGVVASLVHVASLLADTINSVGYLP